MFIAAAGCALFACAVEVGEQGDDLDDEAAEEAPSLAADLPQDLLDQLAEQDTTIIAAGSTNKLGNSSFEAPIKRLGLEAYENWLATGGATRETWARLSGNGTTFTGNWGLRVDGAVERKEAMARQLIRVNGNGRFFVSTWARVMRRGDKRQRLYVYFYDLFGRVVATRSIPMKEPVSAGWEVEGVTVVAPGSAWYLAVGVGKGWTCAGCGDAGLVYYDHVKVQPL